MLVDWGGLQMPLVDMHLVAHGMEEQQLPDGEALERSEFDFIRGFNSNI